MAGTVMIRRCFNDEVVAMATPGTGQGRSAAAVSRCAGAAAADLGGGSGHHAISSGGCQYIRVLCSSCAPAAGDMMGTVSGGDARGRR